MSRIIHGRKRIFLGLSVLGLVLSQAVLGVEGSVQAATASITGQVFNDKNSNGSIDAGEPGVSGVRVAAYSATGVVVGSATTSSDGTYTISSSLKSGSVRVEFTTPAGYQSSFAGKDNGTSIQFVTLPATSVSYGILIPGKYCADNQVDVAVATGCQRPGISTNTNADNNVGNTMSVGVTTWNARGAFSTSLTTKETGAVWGIGNQANNSLVWSSAVIRRHSGLGPKGIGGLYASSPTGGLVASFDLSSYMTLSADNTQYTNAARGMYEGVLLSLDTPGFSGVGKVGIGDIDFSEDGLTLYVMNLYERKVYAFPVGGTATAPTLGTPTSFAVADPGCANANDVRPWGLKVIGSDVFVGVVCSNETAMAVFTAGNTAAATTRPTSGYVRKYATTTSTWSTVTTVNFAYERGLEPGCNAASDISGRNCESSRWHAWTDNFAAIKAAAAANIVRQDGDKFWFSEPIISGLDRMEDGSWVVGIMDRLSRQLGARNIDPTDTTVTPSNIGGTGSWVTSWTHGDTLLICNTGSASSPVYTQESDGSCGTRATLTRTGARLNTSTPYREFFLDEVQDPPYDDHTQISQGAVLVWKNSAGVEEVALTGMDVGWEYYTGGIRWLNSTNGGRAHPTNYYRTFYSEWPNGSQANTTSFGKSAGMADMELLCNNAPIQIGNRIWIDSDKDGIQDPGETSVAGVTVHLYDSTGTTLLGTAITNAKGEYYFASNVTEAAAGNGDNAGGGIVVGKTYVIRCDNPADYTGSGPLAGVTLTKSLATSAATSLDTSIDSNATTVSNYPQITTAVMLAGVNDHTYDIGFNRGGGGVSVGNYVWRDLNGDGYQGKADKGIKGAVLTIRTVSGQPVTDLSGKLVKSITTKADGKYLFTNLPAGQYVVSIQYPRGYIPTTANRTGRGVNSSTLSAKSTVLPTGASDLTLDFGVVYRSITMLPATK